MPTKQRAGHPKGFALPPLHLFSSVGKEGLAVRSRLTFSGYFAVGLVLVGCAPQPPPRPSPPDRFSRAGTTQDAFMADRYQCLHEAMSPVAVGIYRPQAGLSRSDVQPVCGMWRSCMAARGYVVNQQGNLSAPTDTRVSCR